MHPRVAEAMAHVQTAYDIIADMNYSKERDCMTGRILQLKDDLARFNSVREPSREEASAALQAELVEIQEILRRYGIDPEKVIADARRTL